MSDQSVIMGKTTKQGAAPQHRESGANIPYTPYNNREKLGLFAA